MSHLMINIMPLLVEDNIRKIIIFIDNQIKLITLFFSLTDKCSNFATSSWSVMSGLYSFLTIILPIFSKECIYLNPQVNMKSILQVVSTTRHLREIQTQHLEFSLGLQRVLRYPSTLELFVYILVVLTIIIVCHH